MALNPTIGLNMLHMLPEFLERAGVSPARIFRAVGVSDLQAVENGAAARRAQVCAALAFSAKAVGDPAIALSLGAAADPIKLGANGYALFNGRTVLDSLRAHARLLPQLHAPVRIGLKVEGESALWSHEMIGAPGDHDWLLYEGAAAFVFVSLRALAGPRFRPKLVAFPHLRRGPQRVYEDFFEAPVIFSARGPATVTFDTGWLSVKIRRAADALCALPPEGVMPKLGSSAGGDNDEKLDAELETVIDAHLSSGELTLRLAANILGVPERSIQRRLARRGLRFEAMLDALRESKARELLSLPQCSVTQIALELGYSDSAHFIRAFRRWSGLSPTRYRRASASCN